MGIQIAIRGWGAVSPAGWGTGAFTNAVDHASALPSSPLERDGKTHPTLGRRVPPPHQQLPFLNHPRLRRTSPLGRFAAAAAFEALGARLHEVASGSLRTGVIFCEMNGIVEYSRRFYQQVLDNPAHASPILFPETVYNAPASHLSCLLGSTDINYTLLGDSSQFVAGLDLAAHWLSSGRTDACLVVASEELDWLSAEAFHLFEPAIPVAEGAAAIFLERASSLAPGDITLHQIAGPISYSPLFNPTSAFSSTRTETGRFLRNSLLSPDNLPDHFLVDGTFGGSRNDAPEIAVWDTWDAPRFSPLHTTGPAFSVSSGWQCVYAAHLLSCRHRPASAFISALGGTQQAAAAIFSRV